MFSLFCSTSITYIFTAFSSWASQLCLVLPLCRNLTEKKKNCSSTYAVVAAESSDNDPLWIQHLKISLFLNKWGSAASSFLFNKLNVWVNDVWTTPDRGWELGGAVSFHTELREQGKPPCFAFISLLCFSVMQFACLFMEVSQKLPSCVAGYMCAFHHSVSHDHWCLCLPRMHMG